MTAPANGTARWQFWASIVPVALAVLASIIGVYLASTTALTKADALEVRMAAMENLSRRNETEISVMRADMGEIDTQLRSSIDAANLQHAWNLRMDSMLWEKAFEGKSHFPTDNAVYPNIADGKSR